MTLALDAKRDERVCLFRGHRSYLKELSEIREPEFESEFEEDIGDDEIGMIRGVRASQVGSCMDMDFTGLFSSERRRGRLGLLGHYSRNVGHELMEIMGTLWTKIKRKRPRSLTEWFWLVVVNAVAMGVTFLTGIITYESSVNVLRHSLERTILFPIYLPHAIALSIAAKLKWKAFLGIFLGLYFSRIYAAARGMYLISFTRAGVLLAAAVLGTAEVYLANHLLYRQLIKVGSGKKLPTIESIKEALKYLGIVAACTLLFDTVIALLICSSPLVRWSDFYRYWGTNWLGVLSGMLTISPTTTHLFAWQPKLSLHRPKKILEAIALTVVTGTLVIVIFVTNLQTVIYPLPYVLFPIIILTAFRFNRVGCSLIVSVISLVCTWASVRGKGALYRMAGSPKPVSSPKLILQIEMFVSVLGLVGILLAAAVREKKQLARDLHKMNEELESTVLERTLELVKANEALKESQRKAELANQAKSDFLANMSHEIRTPIHGIMGLTSLVLDTELASDQRESLVSVQDCANVLLHIINSILDLAKIEAGRIEVEFVTFNVSELVSSTVRMLSTRAKSKNLDLVWEIDPSVPHWLVGDSGKLQQCILNLIGNAVKFTDEGSVRVHVTVDQSGGSGKRLSARRMTEGQARCSTTSPCVPTSKPDYSLSSVSVFESPADWRCCNADNSGNSSRKSPNVAIACNDDLGCVPIIFEVHDTGIGVSSEKLQDIFTPFTQADASTSRVYGGTGLGLCIVQRFVELLGGKLLAESELGVGSCFSFCVPLGYSTKNREEKACEARDTTALFNLLSSAMSSEASAGEKCCGCNWSPAPPANVRTCTKNCGRCPESSSNVKHPFLSSGEPEVADDQCALDSGGSRKSHGAISESRSDMAAWKPSRSVENLDVLLANWSQNDARMKARDCECACDARMKSRDCECACSNSTTGHKYCNTLCNSATPQGAQQLDTLQQGRNGSQFQHTTVSPFPQQMSSVQSAMQSGSVSPLHQCILPIPPSGFPTVDSDSFNRLKQDAPLITVEMNQPLGFPPQNRGQGREPSSSPQTSASHAMEDNSQKMGRTFNLRVLLAEDNLVNQKVACRQLQKHNHTVVVVGDGVQALETIKANYDSFDLVLMDVQMPNMDGLEATKRIREYEAQQGGNRLPILGLTAHAIHGYEETCLKSGMDGYLGKPFDINQLLRVIERYIPPKDALILSR